MNGVNINFMTKTYNDFVTHYTENEKAAENQFEDIKTEKAASVLSENMTIDEYKQYIYNKISEIPISSTKALASISVNISEEGFKATKNDTEYEKWVLDGLKVNFSSPNPWTAVCGGSYVVHHFGATKEEYHGESWYNGYNENKDNMLYNTKSKDSFWERKIEQKKELEQQLKAIQKRKKLQEEYNEKIVLEKSDKQKAIQEKIISNQVIASYEANFLLIK